MRIILLINRIVCIFGFPAQFVINLLNFHSVENNIMNCIRFTVLGIHKHGLY